MDFYEFQINIIKKPVKHLRLKISPNAQISLNVPTKISMKKVENFLESSLGWLRKTYPKILAQKNATKTNEISYLGQSFELIIDESANAVSVGLFSIIAPNKAELQNFLDNKAKELMLGMISHFAPLINKPINHISFKHMRTRWGSCNSKKGYINLNLDLISKKVEFIEYVVLHELAHLIHANHSKDFYALIATHMPDYKKRIKEGKIS